MSTSEPSLLRQSFNLWERTTAAYLEALVRNPLVLRASGASLGWLLATRKLADDGVQGLIGALGLATRRDQEQTLHLLHTIEGRLDDLEHELGRGAAGRHPDNEGARS